MPEGNLIKMRVELNAPVDYFLLVGNDEVYLNELINKNIRFEYSGIINCISCGKKTKKSFSQGFCYTCMQTAPEADPSVFNPEKSMSQYGISRDMDWAQEHDLTDHFVYLSITGNLKVGVTRHTQIPTRWIDQGAIKAITLAKTPNRHIAGIIEGFLKERVADKTSWQAMLKGEIKTNTNLLDEKERLIGLLHPELAQYACAGNEIKEITYPGNYKLAAIRPVSFDTEQLVEGKLVGIKGQYLIFDDHRVLNIRKHNGYYIKFSIA
jgi:hypothetical protein